jgi:hypothetical protein
MPVALLLKLYRRKSMKKIITSILIVCSFTTLAFAQQKEDAAKKDEPLGLSASLDYYSNYLFRGTKLFNGDGAFYPKVAWNMFNSGLMLSVSSEIASSWVFNGFNEKPDKYELNSSLNIVRKNQKFNHIAYATQSLDFGADYSYTVKDAVTLGASIWYWWYFNSRYAREYARPLIDGLNRVSYVDVSFISTGFSVGLPVVPYINPFVSLTHDYYTGLKRGGDYYIQAGVSHPFELIKEFVLTLGMTASYYYSTTARLTRYTLMIDPGSTSLDTTMGRSYSGATRTITLGGVKQTRTPLKKGFSDVTPYISGAFTKGPLSLSGGFYWCIVPARSWYNGSEIHRYYGKLSIAYAM